MGIIKPNAAIEKRWRGSFDASIHQAPLEIFLRVRALDVAVTGPDRHSDNVARATLYFLKPGVAQTKDHITRTRPHPNIGKYACLVSNTLANVIGQPACWRVAALRSIAQLLVPQFGVNAAACTAATMYRPFSEFSLDLFTADDQSLKQNVENAIALNDENLASRVTLQLAERFADFPAYDPRMYVYSANRFVGKRL